MYLFSCNYDVTVILFIYLLPYLFIYFNFGCDVHECVACKSGVQNAGACLCRTAYSCWYVRECVGADVYKSVCDLLYRVIVKMMMIYN